jgi:hypothetical protein
MRKLIAICAEQASPSGKDAAIVGVKRWHVNLAGTQMEQTKERKK